VKKDSMSEEFRAYLHGLGWIYMPHSEMAWAKFTENGDCLALEGDEIWVKDRENFAYTPRQVSAAVEEILKESGLDRNRTVDEDTR